MQPMYWMFYVAALKLWTKKVLIDQLGVCPKFSKERMVSSESAMFALELRSGVFASLGLARGGEANFSRGYGWVT